MRNGASSHSCSVIVKKEDQGEMLLTPVRLPKRAPWPLAQCPMPHFHSTTADQSVSANGLLIESAFLRVVVQFSPNRKTHPPAWA